MSNFRVDLAIIADLVKPNSTVLDVGCGDGELLSTLKNRKGNNKLFGLEISSKLVAESLSKGHTVVQGDAESYLEYYPNKNFDYVILSQTLQAMRDPKTVLTEMLRIGKKVIVSLPNFAYYKNRFHLLLKGTMPVNKMIPYQWYETPNIHFCSIKDFKILCKEVNAFINKKIYLGNDNIIPNKFGDFYANLFAKYGIFLLSEEFLCPSLQEEFLLAPVKINESIIAITTKNSNEI